MARTTLIKQAILQQIQRFAVNLRRARIPYESLIVFGSHAKGKARVWSDVDVCVVSDEFGQNRFDDRVRLMKITDDDTINIEPHPLSPEELADPWDPLAEEIRRYGIEVEIPHSF